MEASFYDKVYEVVRKIPFGKVCSYGLVAEYLGSKKSARMVGWAMNNSHNVSPAVPAHRVVNRSGLLTGKFHFGSVNLMQELLEAEGIEIKEGQIQRFNDCLWNPSEELG